MGNYKRNRSNMKLLILPILAKALRPNFDVEFGVQMPVQERHSDFPVFVPCFEQALNGKVSIDQCQDENQALFKPKIWSGAVDNDPTLTQSCSCVDPLTGDSKEGQDCMSPCPSEAGNTCKEQRKKDMEFLPTARIHDWAPVICQITNDALYSVTECGYGRRAHWAHIGRTCFCVNPYTRTFIALAWDECPEYTVQAVKPQ